MSLAKTAEERRGGGGETSDWPLLPCGRVSEPLRESKPSNLISRRPDFLSARRRNVRLGGGRGGIPVKSHVVGGF